MSKRKKPTSKIQKSEPPRDSTTKNIVNSVELEQKKFELIHFAHPWKEVMGVPDCNFTMMIYGLPGQGKSTFSLGFAGYLARHHGRVLYLSAEELHGYTMKEKLSRLKVAHKNLDVAKDAPYYEEMKKYKFLFVDSKNKLKITEKDIAEFKALHPHISVIYIAQSIKAGGFKGNQDEAHEVQILAKVSDGRIVCEKNRFNGTEMEINFGGN